MDGPCTVRGDAEAPGRRLRDRRQHHPARRDGQRQLRGPGAHRAEGEHARLWWRPLAVALAQACHDHGRRHLRAADGGADPLR
eukprot:2456730-Alexandrium_andersonii.AAC.1